MILIIVGAVGLAFAYFKGDGGAKQFAYSYLTAYMFFLSLCLGGLFLTLMHHLFDSGWSVPIRRITEHLAFLFPIMAILFIPIALCSHQIYDWMTMDPPDHSLHEKAALVNEKTWYIIAVVLFAVWSFLSWRLRALSLAQDKDGAAKWTRGMRFHSAWGIFAFGFSLTLAAIMWMKTIEHQWYSTMYGVYYFAGSVWVTLVTVYVITLALKKSGPLAGVAHRRQFHDLGMLFLVFTVFYAYIHFSQYFLIWNAAIPEETFWYVEREVGSWWQVGMLLLFGHFLIPFLTMLRIDAKLSIPIMIVMTVWAWICHYMDMAFNVLPHLLPKGYETHLADVGALCFIGGVLSMVFVKYLKSNPVYPQRDPRIAEAMGVYVKPATASVASNLEGHA